MFFTFLFKCVINYILRAKHSTPKVLLTIPNAHMKHAYKLGFQF